MVLQIEYELTLKQLSRRLGELSATMQKRLRRLSSEQLDNLAEALLDFLRHNDADTIYLVGDIVDFWRVRRGAHWPQSHNDVLQKLLRRVRKGVRVVFIPGNHDEAIREFCGMHFGGIEIQQTATHQTANGKRYLVMHGDEFDVVVRTAKWLAFLGDRGYELALWLNNPLNWLRRHLGFRSKS